MADEKSNQMRNVLEKEITIIDQKYLRKLQKKMFQCSSTCCDNTIASSSEHSLCVEKCADGYTSARNYVTSEINNLQMNWEASRKGGILDLSHSACCWISCEMWRLGEDIDESLQMCVSMCNREAKFNMGPNPSESKINSATLEFENCAHKCLDKHINMMPVFVKRVHEVLDEHK